MAYIKGGTVVDGNLYVEGELKVHGNATGEESRTFLYSDELLNQGNHIPVFKSDASGSMISSGISVGDSSESEYQSLISYTLLNLISNGSLQISVPPDKFTFGAFIGTAPKPISAYDENNNRIGEIDDIPVVEPAYWRFDNSTSITAGYSFNSGRHTYTMPDVESMDIDVGEALTVSGPAPTQN